MSETITEETYRRLREDVEEAKSAAERSRGALTQLLTQLEEEFGCASLKEAKAKLEEFEAKKDEAFEKFERALKQYERKWKGDNKA